MTSLTAQRYRAVPRPFDVNDLAHALGLDPTDPCLTSKLVLRLGLDRRWVKRCRRLGLTVTSADHWATLARLHPADVWPHWTDDLALELDTDDWYADDPPIDTLEATA